MLLDRCGIFASAFARLNGEELTLIVPLVECGVLIEAFVALQTDQFSTMHGSERLCDLGLADTGLTFEQQRPLQVLHEPQCGRDIAVSNVAGSGQAVGDSFAVLNHYDLLHSAVMRCNGGTLSTPPR